MTTKPYPTLTILAGVLALLSISASVLAQHPLDSWVRRTVPTPNSALNSVAYGNGTFVAVGENSFVARSTDGVTWTTSTAGAYGTLRRVRFLNGQFVAVGSTDKLIYSSDGASWTANTLPRADFWDVAWGNGVYVIIGWSTYVSSDAVNWTRTYPMVPARFPLAAYETTLDTVVFDGSLFVAIAAGGPAGDARSRPSFFSTNGVDWIVGGAAPNGFHAGGEGELVFQNRVWASIVDQQLPYTDFPFTDGIFTSTNNGASWTRFGNPHQAGVGTGLAAGQGYFVAFSYSGSLRVLSSTNGFGWEQRFAETNSAAVVRAAAYGNGTFLAVGYAENGESYVLQSGNLSGAPIIFQEPQDRSAVVDNPATFTVQVVGGLPLWYQWYKNNNPISGATNTSYAIAHVATSDAGGYYCVVTNSINSVTSRVAQLTVAFLSISEYAGIKILGVPGRMYQIDATAASGAPNWQTLTNLPLPASPYIWIDYDSPTVPARLYRAAELP